MSPGMLRRDISRRFIIIIIIVIIIIIIRPFINAVDRFYYFICVRIHTCHRLVY